MFRTGFVVDAVIDPVEGSGETLHIQYRGVCGSRLSSPRAKPSAVMLRDPVQSFHGVLARGIH